jgi:hypothetical protein
MRILNSIRSQWFIFTICRDRLFFPWINHKMVYNRIMPEANVRMCGCADVQMCGCANVRMCRCADVPMCRYADA